MRLSLNKNLELIASEVGTDLSALVWLRNKYWRGANGYLGVDKCWWTLHDRMEMVRACQEELDGFYFCFCPII